MTTYRSVIEEPHRRVDGTLAWWTHVLPDGTVLGGFEVGDVIAHGDQEGRIVAISPPDPPLPSFGPTLREIITEPRPRRLP